ncbi:YbjN domain-containing protein [Paracoccus sp. DMF-8]|uniref:YbjN domain-containing protein n=1 Tax=Paracoccus sp. DMF-8 TaxID=3019445 RepID=UPI0023E3536D|nr:YbjN domain-containing protein [Paracoccus sp. DMF-8]MDF3607403.1 YbjN domain-containing protein [Paracoccus sp. DMF-8]
MAPLEQYIHSDEIHPIDVAENVATHHAWEFDRLTDDQISMTIEGQWRAYSITLAWAPREEVLRLICTFDMDPPSARLPVLYETLNLVNDEVWNGGFTYWTEQRLMVWRYGLILGGEAMAVPEQIDQMIRSAVDCSERFYPSFQMVCWGDAVPARALDIALGQAYGRA